MGARGWGKLFRSRPLIRRAALLILKIRHEIPRVMQHEEDRALAEPQKAVVETFCSIVAVLPKTGQRTKSDDVR